MTNPIGDAVHMVTEAVQAAGNQLRNIGSSFDGEWQAAMDGINALQGQLGKGPLGAAAMPRLREAATSIGPAGQNLGRKVTGLGGAVGASSGDYQQGDQLAATAMPAG